MNKSILVLSFILCLSTRLNGQILSNDSFIQDKLNYSVKQLSQFINRFNFNDTVVPRKNIRPSKKLNILSLFNSEDSASKNNRNTIDFINQITKDSINTEINFTDSNWYAIAMGVFLYQGKEVKINVTLQVNGSKTKGYKWVIVGVTSNVFLVNEKRDSSLYFINPMNHEIGFTELSKALKEKERIFDCSNTNNLDFLTTFLFMIKKGDIKLMQISKVEFVFLQIPNWIFTVNNFNRLEYNSGWLISKLTQLTYIQKQEYKREELGIKF